MYYTLFRPLWAPMDWLWGIYTFPSGSRSPRTNLPFATLNDEETSSTTPKQTETDWNIYHVLACWSFICHKHYSIWTTGIGQSDST